VKTMKTLVIHPCDPTTDFLKGVYSILVEKTVITGGVNSKELKELIMQHDRVMMMGHGSPWGLLSIDCFPGSGMHIIDHDFSELLKTGGNNVYIWCHADKFVQAHNLKGFFTGMFISEAGEAAAMGLGCIDQQTVTLSNEVFGNIAGSHIEESSVRGPHYLWQNIRKEYGMLAKVNPVANYNNERLYFSNGHTTISPRLP